jgi:hypothetical protein
MLVATQRGWSGVKGNISHLQLRRLLERHEVDDPNLERGHAAARGAERNISRGHSESEASSDSRMLEAQEESTAGPT